MPLLFIRQITLFMRTPIYTNKLYKCFRSSLPLSGNQFPIIAFNRRRNKLLNIVKKRASFSISS